MKVAINGAGIAGPTLAYWLLHFGHEPVLIEKAPRPRAGGYLIDFWGIGYDLAEKMGLIPDLKKRGYNAKEVRWVNDKGRKSGGFAVDGFREMLKGRYITVERSDLAASIYGALDGKVETIFGDSIAGIQDDGDRVKVVFENAAPRDFDLVVGADGLHSRVRELVFGPISQFEKDLGMRVAAFEVEGYQPREELIVTSYAEPGRQVSHFSKRDDKTLFLFVFRDRFAAEELPETDEQRKAALERAFEGVGWEFPQILRAMRGVDEIYYDRVSQIHMEHWTNGRTALLGDAAAAVSLLAGEGSGLAMAEAYVLAGELSRAGHDHTDAFARFEKRLREFVQGKQQAALKVASSFVPDTRLGIIFRDAVTRLLPGRFVMKLGLGSLADDIELPAYENDRRAT